MRQGSGPAAYSRGKVGRLRPGCPKGQDRQRVIEKYHVERRKRYSDIGAVIAKVISKDNIGIVVAQESWVHRGSQSKIILVIWDAFCEKPGAYVMLKSNLKYTRICLLEFMTIKVRGTI